MKKRQSDFTIVGAGVIGLTLARALSSKFPDATINLLEKEQKVGLHTSGRNSGVLHAGFYYPTESTKAKFCRIGCLEWHDFCDEHGIPINKCGKLVASTKQSDSEFLNKLYQQGLKNGVNLEMISRQDAIKNLEPTLADKI